MKRPVIFLAVAALAVAVPAAPVAAESEPIIPVVSGVVVVPEGATVPMDALLDIELQDTALADAPATTISTLTMVAPDAWSPIPFSLSYLETVLESTGSYTLSVRIESADGSLYFINDTVTPAIDEAGPLTDVRVEVVAVE